MSGLGSNQERNGAEPVWLYGFGRTKHIRDEQRRINAYGPALCGVFGGNSLDRPHLPVCKRCERLRQDTPPQPGGTQR